MQFSNRVLGLTFPPFDVLNARAAEMRAAGCPVISLGQALPSFRPPPAAVDAARRALGDDDVHLYSADAGRMSLRSALATRLRGFGIEAGPGELIVTAGGNQAFMLALMTILAEGDEVLLPAPYFINHEMAIRALGGVAVEVPLREENGFGLAWTDLEPFLTPRTRAVALCNPSNPTGATIPEAHGRHIVRELASRNIVAVCDETYMHFVYGGTHWSAASEPRWRENVIVVSSLSKSFGMTGWRIGFLLADAAVCEQAIKVQDAMVICAPAIGQSLAETAVRECWTYPTSFHGELEEKRTLLRSELETIERLHWTPTNGGFFAFVRVRGCTDSAALAGSILERAHLVTIPGATFGATGEGCLRISYGSVSLGDLAEALARLRSFLADWSG